MRANSRGVLVWCCLRARGRRPRACTSLRRCRGPVGKRRACIMCYLVLRGVLQQAMFEAVRWVARLFPAQPAPLLPPRPRPWGAGALD